MLQDTDPLWNAIQDFLKSFEEDFNQHGGLIRRETQALADRLRVQLFADRRREAAKARELEFA